MLDGEQARLISRVMTNLFKLQLRKLVLYLSSNLSNINFVYIFFITHNFATLKR